MDNLRIYNAVRAVPPEAQKKITGGRLNGMTDINPMWRIKVLTELFGPCGEGWTVTEKRRDFVPGANGEVAVLVDIDLIYRGPDGQWADPVHGTGGSMFVAKERNGLYTDDEAVKKAYTDAISVACKALGVGADVYWDKDKTKYDAPGQPAAPPPNPPINTDKLSERTAQIKALGEHYAWGKDHANAIFKDVKARLGLKTPKIADMDDGDFTKVLQGLADAGEHELADMEAAAGG